MWSEGNRAPREKTQTNDGGDGDQPNICETVNRPAREPANVLDHEQTPEFLSLADPQITKVDFCPQ
jgi:hypothetical protein